MNKEHEDKIIKDLEEHAANINEDTRYPTHIWMNKQDYDFLVEHGEEILDKLTRYNEDMGLYDDTD